MRCGQVDGAGLLLIGYTIVVSCVFNDSSLAASQAQEKANSLRIRRLDSEPQSRKKARPSTGLGFEAWLGLHQEMVLLVVDGYWYQLSVFQSEALP